jgi:MFS family permease
MTTSATQRSRPRRDLRLFVAARVVAVAGSAVTGVALPLLVYRLSGSAFQVSLVTASGVAPYLCWGLLAGALADRVPRRQIMVASQALSATALASVVAADAAGQVTAAHAVAVALVVGSCFVWFDAAAFGALPAVVGRSRIVAAQSLVWSTTTLVGIAAPVVGGLLVAAVGPVTALLVDVAAYLLAAALLLTIAAAMGPAPTSTEGTRAHGSSLRSDIAEGIRFIRRHAVVRLLTLLGVGNSVAAGGVTALLVVVAGERYAGADGAAYGALVTAAAAGAFLASLALPWLERRLGVGRLAAGSLAVGLPVPALIGVPAPAPVALALTSLWSAVTTLVVLNGITARQRVTPDALQARVNTTARMVAWGGTPFGALLAGLLAERAGLPTALTATTVVVAATLALSIAAGVLRLRVVEPNCSAAAT